MHHSQGVIMKFKFTLIILFVILFNNAILAAPNDGYDISMSYLLRLLSFTEEEVEQIEREIESTTNDSKEFRKAANKSISHNINFTEADLYKIKVKLRASISDLAAAQTTVADEIPKDRAISKAELCKIAKLANKTLTENNHPEKPILHTLIVDDYDEYGIWQIDRVNILKTILRNYPLFELTLKDICALLTEQDKEGKTLLNLATMNHQKDVATFLLKTKEVPIIGINTPNKLGLTPLHCVAGADAEHTNMAEMLLKLGARINEKDKKHRTPLFYAAFTGNIPMIELLLRYHADINICDINGNTPLSLAIVVNIKAAQLLIRRGAKIPADLLQHPDLQELILEMRQQEHQALRSNGMVIITQDAFQHPNLVDFLRRLQEVTKPPNLRPNLLLITKLPADGSSARDTLSASAWPIDSSGDKSR